MHKCTENDLEVFKNPVNDSTEKKFNQENERGHLYCFDKIDLLGNPMNTKFFYEKG